MTDPAHNPALVPPGISPAAPAGASSVGAGRAQPVEGPSFDQIFRQQQAGSLQFSQHALQRIERRGIDLSDGTLQRLQAGTDRAASKGSRDSVVFVDNTAFVVSVRNKTVITAVDREHMREHVFTNIDSAVIA
ncbi:MAG TPA: TIGR02530 family flagellar biosynthesis protein [Thermoleophilaceae bacterium]